MKYSIFILAIAATAMQSCKNDNVRNTDNTTTTMAVATENITVENAAPTEPADIKDGTVTNEIRKNTKSTNAQTVTKSNNNINYAVQTKPNTYRQPATTKNRFESDNVYVQTTGNNNENLVAAYQVPSKQYNNEVAKVCENKTTANAQSTKYQCVTIRQGNIVATYDQPGDDYKGKDVLSNDGVAKNKERNINYLDFSVSKVPIDGGRWDE